MGDRFGSYFGAPVMFAAILHPDEGNPFGKNLTIIDFKSVTYNDLAAGHHGN